MNTYKPPAKIMSGLVLFMLAGNCVSVDLRQAPVPSGHESSFESSRGILFLGMFEAWGTVTPFLARGLRIEFRSELASARRFHEVKDAPRFIDLGAEDYLVDLTFAAEYHDNINWWASWPAIYPMVGFWPFQVRKHAYRLKGEYVVFDGSHKTVAKGVCEVGDAMEYTIYGFYRVEAAEQMVYRVNEGFLKQCAEKVVHATNR